MENIKTRIRRWGNSFGVVIPSTFIKSQNLEEGSEVEINISFSQKTRVKDLLEMSAKLNLKKPKRSTQEILNEIDEELWEDQ